MNLSLKLGSYRGFFWEQVGSAWVIGCLHRIEKETLAAVASRCGNAVSLETDLLDFLEKQCCFFSIVIDSEESVYLAVDHLGSFPLFFSVDRISGTIVVSDDAPSCSKSKMIDDLGLLEYQCTYVTYGGRTLWEDVREVNEGTYVRIDKKIGSVEERRYWEFKRAFPSSSASLDQVEDVVRPVFRDVIRFLDGRTAVIPITSGLDSRTIAACLKAADYERVLTFSIGARDSEDVMIGKRVASNLGFPWEHVEITGEMWRERFGSDRYREALRYSILGGRINHILMAFALDILKGRGALPDDAVFLPGHAGSIMGGELKCSPVFKRAISKARLVANSCLVECRIDLPSGVRRNRLESVIADLIDLPEGGYSYKDCAAAADTIHTIGYINKFIVNDVRNYESANYEWYLPLLDRRWCDFWMNVSFEDAWRKELIRRFVNEGTAQFGLFYEKGDAPVVTLRNIVKSHAHLISAVRRIKGCICRSPARRNAYFSAYGQLEFKSVLKKNRYAMELPNAKVMDDSLAVVLEDGLLQT